MQSNRKYQRQLFLNIDGIVLLPIFNSLLKNKVLHQIENLNEFSLTELSKNSNLNNAYMNIALRTLVSTNFLDIKTIDNKNPLFTTYGIKNNSLQKILSYEKYIYDINYLIPFYNNFNNTIINDSIFNDFIKVFSKNIENVKKIKEDKDNDIYFYFEGLMLAPFFAYLGFYNIISNNKIKCENKQLNNFINKILIEFNFADHSNEKNKKRDYYFKRLTAFGVTSSYLPMFEKLDQLLFDNSNFIWDRIDGDEIHVNRKLNIWGSGGAHKIYFDKIDDIIIDVFNQEINEQPTGIIDIGCGDGTFLKHVYEIIITKTKRKEYLDKFPLKIIGIDINKAARIETRKQLNKLDIENIVINGNIGTPNEILKELQCNFNEDINNYLCTRTFLDHNRIYSKPKELSKYSIKTSGAFAYKGQLITKNKLINNQINHFKKWKNVCNKYGLIVLELHTINPLLSATNRGKTLSVAYDATHGFSDQYLIEYEAFKNCAKEAGFKLINSILFPDNKKTTISINYFT